MKYENDIEETLSCDILVAGSGPAGIAAAIEAARHGFETVMIEKNGYVGGAITSNMVTTLMGDVAQGTIGDEIRSMLGAKDSVTAIDAEEARHLLEDFLVRNNVRIFLLTTFVDTICEGDFIKYVVVKTKKGLEAFKAKVFIDATGDGELAYSAKVPFSYGRDDGLVQPVSIMYHIDGVDKNSTIHCTHEEDDFITKDGRSYLEVSKEAERSGELPKDVSIVRLYPGKTKGEYLVNATQKGKVDTLDVAALTKASFDLRQQVNKINAFIKKNVPGFENIRTLRVADSIGVRESRRFEGEYTLTADDVIMGRKFDDVVVHAASFPIDIHNPEGGGQAETDSIPVQCSPYDIPMRCLIPKKIKNLVLSGRNISGTHRAHASYRVMRIAMAVGQASGAIACVLCRSKSASYADVRSILEKDGVILEN